LISLLRETYLALSGITRQMILTHAKHGRRPNRRKALDQTSQHQAFLQQVQVGPQVQLSPQLHPSLQTGHVALLEQQVHSAPHLQLSPQVQPSLQTGQGIIASGTVGCPDIWVGMKLLGCEFRWSTGGKHPFSKPKSAISTVYNFIFLCLS